MTHMDYDAGLAAYKHYLAATGWEVNDLRAEHQFESLRDWSILHTWQEVQSWFRDRRNNPSMIVEEIPLNHLREWSIDPTTGAISHASGEFFVVKGLRVFNSASREVGSGGWDQPILEQIGLDGGILGLLRQRFQGIPHYLVEAKAEPGNFELIQLSPTLQATFSNLKMAHAGRKPRFAEFFEDPEKSGAQVLYDQWLSEDGGRLNKKRNKGMLIEVPEGTLVESDGFLWMSMFQIKEALKENAWVNPHIRGIIAHL